MWWVGLFFGIEALFVLLFVLGFFLADLNQRVGKNGASH